MKKRSTITHVTALPSYVSRAAVLELLHDHSTLITLNPLVTNHGQMTPPAHALEDEKNSAWYEVTDKIEYVPGTNLTGSVTYTACMHDTPNGLQTHIHAPAGLEIRAKWQLLGRLPGEKPSAPEIGVEQYNVPREGLYIREDCEIKCNILLINFVKRNMLKSHKVFVERLLQMARERTGFDWRNDPSAAAAFQEPASTSVLGDSSNDNDDEGEDNLAEQEGMRMMIEDRERYVDNREHTREYSAATMSHNNLLSPSSSSFLLPSQQQNQQGRAKTAPPSPSPSQSQFNERRQRAVLELHTKGYSVSVSGGTQQNVRRSSSLLLQRDNHRQGSNSRKGKIL